MNTPRVRPRTAGFTLVELVVTLVITAIVAAFSITLIAAPPATLDASGRRAELRENALEAMESIAADWRSAQPNTLRYRSSGGVLAIEHLAVMDSATLFTDSSAVNAAQRLSLGTADSLFETLGTLPQITKPLDTTSAYLSLAQPSQNGSNPWSLTNFITTAGTRIQISASSTAGQAVVQISPAITLGTASSGNGGGNGNNGNGNGNGNNNSGSNGNGGGSCNGNNGNNGNCNNGSSGTGAALQRIYVVSGPVTWLCNATDGTLQRYSGYSLAANQNQRDTDAALMAAGATRVLLVNTVTRCSMASTPSAAANQTVYFLTVTFADGSEQLALNVSTVNDNGG
jgi:prepilin-type N-terminal cleavage/methylation domain-containing protein